MSRISHPRAAVIAALASAGLLVNDVPVTRQEPNRRTHTPAAAVQVVSEWVAAVNAQDIPGVVARSTRDVVLGGPRGSARGQKELRDWVERAGLQMTTDRVFAAGTRVVLLQQAAWRDRRGLVIAEATVANRFEVAGDRVSAVTRYDSLSGALADAGLTEADEQHGPAGDPGA